MAETTNTDDYPDQYYAEIRYKEQQAENSFYHWENSWCPKGPGSTVGWDKDGDAMPRETASHEPRQLQLGYASDWKKRRSFAWRRMAEQRVGRPRAHSESRLRMVEVADYTECPIEMADFEERPRTVGTPLAPASDWMQRTQSHNDCDSRPRIVETAESPERPNTVESALAPMSNWSQLAPPGRTSNWADDDEVDDEVYFGFATATAPVTEEPAASQPEGEEQVAPSASPGRSLQAADSNITATSDNSNSDHGMIVAMLEAQLEDTQVELEKASTTLRSTEIELEAARKSYRAALSAQETSNQSTLSALAEADRDAEKYRLSAQRFNEEFIAAKNAQLELEKRLATMTKELEDEKERSKRYRRERDQQADKKERVEDKYDQAKAMVESTRHRLKEAERQLAQEKAEKELLAVQAEQKLVETMDKLAVAEAEKKFLEVEAQKTLEAETERKLAEAEKKKRFSELEKRLAEAEERERARVAVEAEQKQKAAKAERREQELKELERQLREEEEKVKARMAVGREERRQREAEREDQDTDRAAKPRRSELGLAMDRCNGLMAKQKAILATPPKPIVPIAKWAPPVWSDEMKVYFRTIGYTFKE